MRVSIISDLHLEFAGLSDLPGGDVLILAGDILTVRHLRSNKTDADSRSQRKRFEKFFREEVSKYGRSFYVTGNHEPYSANIDEMNDVLRQFLADCAPNTRLLANETEVIDGVAFLGTPLWASCGVGNPILEMAIGSGMNDFRLIQTNRPAPEGAAVRMVGNERLFTPRDANQLHQEAVAWLRSELPKHDRCVVIGHHAPSLLSAAGDRTEDLDLAYCSNQHALIEANPQIIAWIHGHTHREERYQIGETKIIANPRGYFPEERRSRNFDPAAADFTLWGDAQ